MKFALTLSCPRGVKCAGGGGSACALRRAVRHHKGPPSYLNDSFFKCSLLHSSGWHITSWKQTLAPPAGSFISFNSATISCIKWTCLFSVYCRERPTHTNVLEQPHEEEEEGPRVVKTWNRGRASQERVETHSRSLYVMSNLFPFCLTNDKYIYFNNPFLVIHTKDWKRKQKQKEFSSEA